ncbi:M81 family metallopeptidase [Ottowia thiooxydans]|uniref:M81 family metallopeptidase n=1 Tax=Ottowia thiooxydans TaxID=219182 RepID=UPI00040FC081|nr:M81 family metallopeptidase [Ottowia thiooxydans]
MSIDSAPRKKRLAVARFWYEGNVFCPVPCTQEDFDRREWRTGSDALAVARDTATELGAVERFARTRTDWEVVALRCASALPGGAIDDEVFTRFYDEVLTGLAQGGQWDAVYLSLHGASITNARHTPEMDILSAVRFLLPGVPIGASFDLHANLSPGMGPFLDMASGYKTYPHIDMLETAQRVLDGLLSIVEQGRRTRVTVVKPRAMLPSFNMRTAEGPMKELQELAAAQIGPGVVEALVFGGFPYSDTPDTGSSVVIVSDLNADPEGKTAAAVSAKLEEAVRALAPRFAVQLPNAEEGLRQGLEALVSKGGLVAVTDPGDNPLSGGACDTPGLLAALLQTDTTVPCLFASFADADSVRTLHEAGIGAQCKVALGGKLTADFGPPVEVTVRVERLTDGVFRNTGPMETGVETRCGRTALVSLVDRPNIQVIVTSSVAPANDPGFFALHGIDLDASRLLCVKAKNHFRAAFLDRCQAIIDTDVPGPSALDLDLLPFRYADRSLAPK